MPKKHLIDYLGPVSDDNQRPMRDWGTKQVPTNDNWCGTYEDGTVKGCVQVICPQNRLDKPRILHVSFWGNDDLGMEIEMPFSLNAYLRWNAWLTGLSYIDMHTLHGLGFEFC